MFIRLENDIFENIEKVVSPFDVRFRVIDSLFESMYDGKHIVYCNYRYLNKMKNISNLSIRTKLYTQWICRNYTQIYSCRDIVSSIISVSQEYDSVKVINNIIQVPLDYFISITETRLLTEHESDAKFFICITKYMFEKKGHGNRYYCSVNFENDSYHGANGRAKIEQLSAGKKIVLVIVDTDKDYPDDHRKSTYTNVNNAVKKAKRKIPVDLLELPVREKENLFPAIVYREICDNPLIRIIAENFPDDEVISQFFDIKEGVKNKQLQKHDAKWETYYKELIAECASQKICNESATDDVDKHYICGIGDKVCDSVVDVLFETDKAVIKNNNKYISDAKIDDIYSRREQIMSNIPEFVYNNWECIAEKMFTWGCCIDSSRYPAQRNW